MKKKPTTRESAPVRSKRITPASYLRRTIKWHMEPSRRHIGDKNGSDMLDAVNELMEELKEARQIIATLERDA